MSRHRPDCTDRRASGGANGQARAVERSITSLIARLGAGEMIGEISFVDTRPPLATVTATQPTMIFALDRDQLYDKLERDSRFAAHFYRAVSVFLADRLRHTVVQLGYGVAQQPGATTEFQGELDERVLDNVHLAGARFDRLLKRFAGA